MGKLSAQQRDRLPSHVYGLPDKRAYPMPDRGHAEYAIKVAAIQHSRGNLSAEQYAAIHAKAMGVLHGSDGGPVSLRGKNNMQRGFAQHANASVKHMADGGAVDENAYDTQIGAEHGSGNYSLFDSTGAAKTPSHIVEEVGDVPPQGHKLPMGKATNGFDLRGLWEAPKPTPYTNLIGVRGADGGAVDKTVGGNYFAKGGPINLRDIESKGRNGMVRGPGGPRDDKVPAMLSDGEYVLPAKTVAHVGKENLDALVEKTNDGREPGLQSLRERYADGGTVLPETGVNPKIPIPGVTVSPEAAAHIDATKTPFNPEPLPGASAQPAASAGRTMFGTGDDWKRMGNSLRDGIAKDASATGRIAEDTGMLGRVGSVVGKVAKPLAPVTGAIETASGLAQGDKSKTALGLADTVAGGALYSPAAPLAATYLAGRTGWDAGKAIYSHLPESLRDKIGGTIDQIGINSGLSQGHDLSPDQVSNVNAAPAAQPAAPAAAQPASVVPAASSGDESDGLTDSAPTSLRVDRNGNNVSITGGDTSPEAYAAADRAAYAARFNDARARAQDPEYQRARAEYDAGTVTPSLRRDDMASPDGFAPGSIDSLVTRHDRRMAQEEARSLRENSTTRRGQDITAATQTYGHELSARTARMQAQLDMFKSNRQFGFEYGKSYGTGPGSGGGEVGRAEQKAREDAVKTTQDRVASMIPPIKDAKNNTVPDTANAARYSAGLNAVLGQKMEDTRQYLAKNPGDANAQAWLQRAQRDGLAALDESDIRKHITGMQAADIAQQQHSSWNPFYGTAVTSDAPVTSLRRVHRTILPDQYKTNRGDTIPASDIDKAGSLVFGLGGQRRRDFDILKQPDSLRDR